jgi:pyruvate,orthophosphate dikinase
MTKWIYSFGDKKAQGNKDMKSLLGGKGANLAEMCLIGIDVPPGFTISTEVCSYFYDNNQKLPNELLSQINIELARLSELLNLKFGDLKDPLLLSVRSGSRSSMPGMMDTILNIGLNDQTVITLAKKTNNEIFAYDTYRRLIQMYSSVVLDIDHYHFEELLEMKKRELGISLDHELTSEALKELITDYKHLIIKQKSQEFPQDVNIQLQQAIISVFKSWMNQRAITYRKINNIPEDWGTAVNIQSMVFGNMGNRSATGVAFTRDPSTGENNFYGEYLVNAQGEDVVAGIRDPQSISKIGREKLGSTLLSMEESMTDIYGQLVIIYKKLESHYKDMQDIEFTVENDKLWILQTRSGKRSVNAAIKIAVDMVHEGLITKEEAILRIEPASIDQLLHPTLDLSAKTKIITKGLPASPGGASGIVIFNSDDVVKITNKQVILVRTETSPEDIHGMHAALGILTARGGMTSHAAVVARGMGKPCVCGASEIIIDYQRKFLKAGEIIIKEGDIITIDGSTGEVMIGEVPTIQPIFSKEFKELMSWADSIRKLEIRANAETPLDARVALEFGAKGIGLCRTEHMFFDENKINIVREMILANDVIARKNALSKLMPMQKNDFIEIFKVMTGLPVNIRLLDPPLHEFLPISESHIKLIADKSDLTIEEVRQKSEKLKEANPMLGHRGCRLGISYPEIYQMQARAIFEAMIVVNHDAIVEIMVPLILGPKELEIIKNLIDEVAKEVTSKFKTELRYLVGTMIELPRAALCAGEIAKTAEFFSFGTNDLTQTTLGISRDDSGSFLNDYKDHGIFSYDPFVRLDQEGVGEVISIAIERGRRTNKNIKLGICGEHGGDPESVIFFHKLGLHYVSCSAYRVPIARLAAAHAAILNR